MVSDWATDLCYRLGCEAVPTFWAKWGRRAKPEPFCPAHKTELLREFSNATITETATKGDLQ